MPTPQEYARQFAQHLGGARAGDAVGMMPGLQALIDAIPPYGYHEFHATHRGALSNLLEVSLPNETIIAQGGGSGYSYDYDGPYSGYRDAFYHGVSLTPAASNLAAGVLAFKATLNNEYWSKYGVTVLTDAIRQAAGGQLDTGKLSSDLENHNREFLPALSASYYAVFCHDYGPTSQALGALRTSGQIARAGEELRGLIAKGQFTAGVNHLLDVGGDSAANAAWLLFNLWVTLKALGDPDVDGAIRQFQGNGLGVPPQVGPGQWWGGGYTTWWIPLSGSDVMGAARNTLQTGLPESQHYTSPPQASSGGSSSHTWTSKVNVPNGYCWSLINWGSLNWYNPQPASCFGRGTGVLMADGSVRAIEQVKRGDEVQSAEGAKRVLLVVSPLRAGRPLYGLNRLNVYFTAAHPFRTPEGDGAARAAVDPWALIDSAATMTGQGVATLLPGRRLSARVPGGDEHVTVGRLDDFAAAAEGGERLYDLVLERSDAGVSCYYVGGPGTFLATDTEWPDPAHEPTVTHAIIKAMETALPGCRASPKSSVTLLPDILYRVQLGAALPEAREVALAAQEGVKSRPAFDLGLFMHEGEWDPHASALGNNLVRRFARTMRREIAMGWRVSATLPRPGHQLSVAVHDVQLLGDVPIGPNARLGLELRLRGLDSPEETVRGLEAELGERPVWHVALDEVLEFGRTLPTTGSAALLGSLTLDGQKVGEFLAMIDERALTGGTAEYFLFSVDGKIVGRLAMEPRRSSDHDLARERERRKAWASHHTHALAEHLGNEIVRQIVAEVRLATDARKNKGRF
jgi:hypothetical protein